MRKKNSKIEKAKGVGHFLVQNHARAQMSKNAILGARRTSCHVANAISTRLKVIWPRCSRKTTKRSQNAFLGKSSRSQWSSVG